MKRRRITAGISSIILGLLGVFGFGRRAISAATPSGGMMGGMMNCPVSGDGMNEMMGPGNMMGPMRLGMELFERHASIARKTYILPNGIVDTTTSSDPTTADIIKAHVLEMYQRLDQSQPFPYPMSPSVTAMFANDTAYRRSYKLLPDGIEVTETSDDPEMLKMIYAHAKELDGFAKYGMPAMMRGMMNNQN
ncbi:MAG: hypothetical protein POH28_11325 [Acidocella sp.]|nr:hypothetical protein [Acidocella sp.]MDE8346746.1 hypothetical protein [Acidocella sp.]